MAEISWIGSRSGTLLITGSTNSTVRGLDDLAVALNRRATELSSQQQRILGNCAFFLALREASGNDPILPAADRIMGFARITPSGSIDRRAFDSGCEELRQSLFAIRGSPPNELLTTAYNQLMKILAEQLPVNT